MSAEKADIPALAEGQSLAPRTHIGSSQLPVTPSLEYPILSSGFHGYTHMCKGHRDQCYPQLLFTLLFFLSLFLFKSILCV